MEVLTILQGPSLTRFLQGAGAVVTMIVDFNWGGWPTSGSWLERDNGLTYLFGDTAVMG
jgi:hypothetical protein